MIEVSELTKRYGPVTAIDKVSFKVEKGEILGFLGPNGAGKSTTMRILTGALGATSGRAAIAGFDISEKPKEAKRRFGYLPELPPVYPEMTVFDYVDYVGRLHGVAGKDRKQAVGRALDRCGLTQVSDRLIGHLSKGFQQRVGLAQALVHSPPVLILDEPTVGLDPNQIIEIRKLIKELAGEHTIILSTHILPEVQMTCERVVIIKRGRIIAQDTIENLTAQAQKGDRLSLLVRVPGAFEFDSASARVKELLGSMPGVMKLQAEPAGSNVVSLMVESEKDQDLREGLAHRIVTAGFGLLELGRLRVSLEEVFHELTTEEVSQQEQAVSQAVSEGGAA